MAVSMPGALAGLCGLLAAAAPVSGQTVTLHFHLDGDPFNSVEVVSEVAAGAEPVTWTVFASFTGYPDPDAHFLSFAGAFVPVGDLAGSVRHTENLLDQSFSTPVVDGAAIENIWIENNTNFQGISDHSNPLAIFRFGIVADDASDTGDGPARLSYDAVGIASVLADEGIFTLADEFEDFAVISDVLVVPGPGPALGVGGGLVWCAAGVRSRRVGFGRGAR